MYFVKLYIFNMLSLLFSFFFFFSSRRRHTRFDCDWSSDVCLPISSRDLITIFVALETLSIPAYMLAGWRKRDLKSNEASLKYYLLGVLASAVMLYGMSLIYGFTGSTVLRTIGREVGGSVGEQPIVTLGIFFIIVGFAFKVSAVPFHFWAPDTYEGA